MQLYNKLCALQAIKLFIINRHNTMKYILTIAALLIGGLLAIQGSINAQLSGYLKHPLQAALVNFMIGTCCLVLVNILLRTELPKTAQLSSIPFHLYIGGALGAL